MMYKFDFDKYKWLFVIFISLTILIYLNIIVEPYEHVTNVTSGHTVRKLDDYLTPKTIPETRVVNIKCKMGGKDYFLGKIKKDRFNANCPACNLTNLKDNTMLVLVDSRLIINENCYNEELIKCYNTQNIADCPQHAAEKCDAKKIGSSSTEFIIDNVTQGETKDGVITPPSYSLRFNNTDSQGIMLSLWEFERKIPTEDKDVNLEAADLPQRVEKNYMVCIDDIIGAMDDKQKLYLDTTNLPRDKIRFKIFFNVNNQTKYLGVSKTDLCENIVCTVPECENDYKFLRLYDNIDDENILVFEPELIRHLKQE
jgi:hypothetical protein